MALTLPRQLAYEPAWQESSAMREWMRRVTEYVNAPAAGAAVWRGQSVRYASVNSATFTPSQVGMNWGAGTSTLGCSAGAFYSSLSRITITTAGGAPSESVSLVDNVLRYCAGDANTAGGYRIELVVGPGCGAGWGAGAVMFAGLAAATPTLGVTAVSALTDVIGLEITQATGSCNIIHNDSAGTATSVSLGTAFPTSGNQVYALTLEMARNGTAITYTVDRLDNTQTTTGTISTNFPAATTFLKLLIAAGTPGYTNTHGACFFRALSEQPN